MSYVPPLVGLGERSVVEGTKGKVNPRPTPIPAQCRHEHTYYDHKGERCKDCGAYIRRTR